MVMNSVYKLDYINIALMLVSCVLAFIIPFELFLFAYGVLGPLHYLTEISWLHDKNYYSTGKRDVILMLVISLALTLIYLLGKHNPELLSQYIDPGEDRGKMVSNLTFIAFGSALFFAFIKNTFMKAVGVFITVVLVLLINQPLTFFTVFLPTLVHVYIFTLLFMLYGALKSRSKAGYVAVLLHIIIPFLLFYLFPSYNASTEIGKDYYKKSDFGGLNLYLFSEYFFTPDAQTPQLTQENIVGFLYNSKFGIAIMRFIAFAYMYHYLNWFSKTEIIRWHKVPKSRFIFVIVAWIVSIILYSIDYSLGFQWLFLLSFMHVLLEFPLNYISFVGIFKELSGKGVKQTATA